MSSVKLNPYLNFEGNTREAMEFYRSVFGGELKITTFGAFPGMEVPPGYADKVMHATLESGAITLMASEGQPGQKLNVGDHVSLMLSGPDDATLSRYFAALAEGGRILMPLEQQVWGDKFGLLVDRFGIQWMVNIAAAQ